MILFLDFDGVLHPDPCLDANRLFEHAQRLAEVLQGFPEIGVVLSTSWRYSRPHPELLAALPPGLRERVIGATPRYSDFAGSVPPTPFRRQAECLRWLQQHGMAATSWIALDDRPDWFAPYCENLIECNPSEGFSERIGARLASTLALARMRRGRELDLQVA